ncbi:hypothetical protein [[Muricauda] lutisoli]|uniref:Uncharacterized protein n=1 Tax=[Muricauda] lutisoli TaxID=2816035 RepID=A0ABS3EVV0_9FLAO|nr:hypothetical protein [[Muricauda] lutisoli]MBO0330343.1 hypothetical protein [[Muricauda] lutisoli]
MINYDFQHNFTPFYLKMDVWWLHPDSIEGYSSEKHFLQPNLRLLDVPDHPQRIEGERAAKLFMPLWLGYYDSFKNSNEA